METCINIIMEQEIKQPKTQEQEISSERIRDERHNIYSMLLQNSNQGSEKCLKTRSKAPLTLLPK